MKFGRDRTELLPELLLEDDPYAPIRQALSACLEKGASTPEAVRLVAAELDDEGQREMIELGLLCLVFGFTALDRHQRRNQ